VHPSHATLVTTFKAAQDTVVPHVQHKHVRSDPVFTHLRSVLQLPT
jgi:hypothetical protein